MIPSYEQCQYNWELDIKNALPPPIVGYEPKVYTPEELNRPLTFGAPALGPPYWLVTADPNDTIVLTYLCRMPCQPVCHRTRQFN